MISQLRLMISIQRITILSGNLKRLEDSVSECCKKVKMRQKIEKVWKWKCFRVMLKSEDMLEKCWRCHLGSGSCQPPSFLFAQAATSAVHVFKLFLLILKSKLKFSKHATYNCIYEYECMHAFKLFLFLNLILKIHIINYATITNAASKFKISIQIISVSDLFIGAYSKTF